MTHWTPGLAEGHQIQGKAEMKSSTGTLEQYLKWPLIHFRYIMAYQFSVSMNGVSATKTSGPKDSCTGSPMLRPGRPIHSVEWSPENGSLAPEETLAFTTLVKNTRGWEKKTSALRLWGFQPQNYGINGENIGRSMGICVCIYIYVL